MFKKFRFTRKIENILMLTFAGIFLAYISTSSDMNIESLKGVLVIGITVGIIYGLVAVGISLIYTGLDVVNFSNETIWEGSIKEGYHCNYYGNKKAYQHISEASQFKKY